MTKAMMDRIVEILRDETEGVVDAYWENSQYLCARFHRLNAVQRIMIIPPVGMQSAYVENVPNGRGRKRVNYKDYDPYDYRNESEFTMIMFDAIDQAKQELQPTPSLPAETKPQYTPGMAYNYDIDHEPPLPD